MWRGRKSPKIERVDKIKTNWNRKIVPEMLGDGFGRLWGTQTKVGGRRKKIGRRVSWTWNLIDQDKERYWKNSKDEASKQRYS